ncbi:MAG TPA: zinc-ribbon domain-containing protein, partial [Candidatus Deferrimicrobiaceae bacterium]|nr:zinc-ribbon domain-containing protein [Candidatus Deferrimicrobiaceae bacterium]
MIIECQACRARFKLDESRIKGKGARIRCRKCGESIIVMKGEIPAEKPSAPVGKELFDLRSVLREPERRAAAPSKNKVDATFETPLRKDQEPDPAAQESAEPPRGTASEVGEEVEAAFDRLLDRDREREVAAQESAESYPEVPPSPAAVIDAPVESPLDREQKGEPEPPSVVAEAPVSADREPDVAARELAESFAEVSPPYLEEVDASFDTPLFGEEVHSPPKNGKLLAGDFREPSEKDPRAATILGEEEPEADRKPLEFLVLDTDSSDMLNKDRTLQEPPKSFDISEQLSQAPRWALEEDPAPTPPTPQPDPLPGAADDLRANKIQEELAGLGERNLREEIFGPEPPPPDLSPPKPLKMERKPLMAPRASKPSRRPSVTLLALLFATLAAAGA